MLTLYKHTTAGWCIVKHFHEFKWFDSVLKSNYVVLRAAFMWQCVPPSSLWNFQATFLLNFSPTGIIHILFPIYGIFLLLLQVCLWFKIMYEYKTRRDVSTHIWNEIVPYFHMAHAQCLLNLVCYKLRIKTLKLACNLTTHVFCVL